MCALCDEPDKDITLNGLEICITKDGDINQLCIESDFDYNCGCNNYSYINIGYCPVCGREL